MTSFQYTYNGAVGIRGRTESPAPRTRQYLAHTSISNSNSHANNYHPSNYKHTIVTHQNQPQILPSAASSYRKQSIENKFNPYNDGYIYGNISTAVNNGSNLYLNQSNANSIESLNHRRGSITKTTQNQTPPLIMSSSTQHVRVLPSHQQQHKSSTSSSSSSSSATLLQMKATKDIISNPACTKPNKFKSTLNKLSNTDENLDLGKMKLNDEVTNDDKYDPQSHSNKSRCLKKELSQTTRKANFEIEYNDASSTNRKYSNGTNNAISESTYIINGPTQFYPAAAVSNYKSSNLLPSPSSTSSSSSSSSPPLNTNTKLNALGPNLNIYDINEYENKGIVGLRNLGNTCFMNSILQCLSNTKCLLEYCLNGAYSNDLNTTLSVMKGSLFKSYASLIKTMWKSNDIVSPQDFKSQIARFAPRFVGYAQQDAEEFLYYLLKGLHEDVNLIRKKPSPIKFDEKAWDRMSDSEKSKEHWDMNLRYDNSRISEMFVGQLKSTLQCTKCNYRSPTYELFWHLALPIPHKQSSSIKLDDCLKLFTTEEILDGDNKPVCSTCKEKRRCTKRYTMEKLPKILVIHLKRFSKTRFNNKINVNIDYPIEGLDMSKYLSNNVDLSSSSSSSSMTSVRQNSSSPNYIYDLYGISLHSGTESSGHYVAYCKHPYNKTWHFFNDSMVRRISNGSLQDSNAYILFYQLRGT